MPAKPFLRDLALLAAAAAIGWWAHGASPTVSAQSRGSSSSPESSRLASDGLAFQLSGMGPETALTLYNSANHTLYVYPAANGNSHINCAFSFHIDRPGAPIDRENCPIGSAFAR